MLSLLPSVPCPPTSVSSSVDCLSNIAVVSWASSEGADFYLATATHEDGQIETCMSDDLQCGMPNLRCGENYTITVSALSQQCTSDPSEGDILQTGED
uniref:Fibronectin type-III domain-containing protein n=1 Tax=Myripristis murdjan TaxID=586833 RepID=A0A667X0J4_9TELE